MPKDRNEERIREVEEELAREKLLGIGLWASLERHPRERRLAIIRNNPRMHNRGLYERLLEVCREEWFRDPVAAAEIAELALAVAETLDDQYSAERIADFQATALSVLGNARRLASDFEGAARAFHDARALLARGSRDLLKEASLVSLEASLLKDLGGFEEAVEFLNRAVEIYQETNHDHLRGRTLIQQGGIIGHVQPERGVDLIQNGLALIDPLREPRLKLCGRNDLAFFLNESGRPRDALAVLESARPLYAQFNDPWTRLRLHWLEGRIARGLGHLPEAEEIFRRLCGELQESVYAHELTLVSLDLAEVYTLRDRHEEALRLVDELQPVLKAWGMHAEGRAVWLLMVDAVRRRTAHAEAFRRMADYIRRAWHRPIRRGEPVS